MPIKLDNTPDKYAEEIICWAKDAGILKGNTNGNLMLHDGVTRQDVLVFLYRLFQVIIKLLGNVNG